MSQTIKNIFVFSLAGAILIIILIISVLLIVSQMKKEKIATSSEPNLSEQPPESAAPQKKIYYLTATVTEKRENELAVSGLIPETAFSGKEEPRLITTDEKTQVIKILADDYQAASFSDIKKGDKIVVSTFDDFKNNESVLALTVSLYPALNK